MNVNVLRTIPSYFPVVSGPANQARAISCGLLPYGIHSKIVTANETKNQAPSNDFGISVQRLDQSLGIMAYRMTNGLESLWKQDFDLLHAHNYRNRLTTEVARIARKRDRPFVLQPHGSLAMFRHVVSNVKQIPYHCFDLVRRNAEIYAADRIVVATHQEKNEAIRFGVPEGKIHVIPVGAEPMEARSNHDRSLGPLKLLFVGRICEDRNLDQLIQAIHLVNRPDDIQLTIVGPAAGRSRWNATQQYLQQLKTKAQTLNLKNIEFAGARYGETLADTYRAADAFVYTSAYENFGQSLLEAAAAGCPLIATPVGVANDLVIDGQTGFLVPHGDAQQTAEIWKLLLDRRSLLNQMSERILARVQHDYTWPAVIESYHRLYRELVG